MLTLNSQLNLDIRQHVNYLYDGAYHVNIGCIVRSLRQFHCLFPSYILSGCWTGPMSVSGPWTMSFVVVDDMEGEGRPTTSHKDDQYQDHGAHMAMSAAVKAIEYQKQLTGLQAESFANALDKNINRLYAAFDTRVEAQRTLPLEPHYVILSSEGLRAFRTPGRKRAMTGREAAEAEERDASRARRRREIEVVFEDSEDEGRGLTLTA